MLERVLNSRKVPLEYVRIKIKSFFSWQKLRRALVAFSMKKQFATLERSSFLSDKTDSEDWDEFVKMLSEDLQYELRAISYYKSIFSSFSDEPSIAPIVQPQGKWDR